MLEVLREVISSSSKGMGGIRNFLSIISLVENQIVIYFARYAITKRQKHLWRSEIFENVAGRQHTTFPKINFLHRCF